MVGRTIAHYTILEKLGEGGMGVVYKARDTHLDRLVAIKVLPPERLADPERRHRFKQEARAASALNHPNIITIHDIDQAGGVDFIAMEYVAGKTLERLIPRHGLRLNDALQLAAQIADALARAHAAGILHRDIKPGNIMVSDSGSVKVLDFGLAKLTEGSDTGGEETTRTAGLENRTMPSETEEGVILGTAAYMSPEQAQGVKADSRSDIFSFGSVIYEMLTGHSPFRRDSKMATLAAILRDEPAPPSQVVDGLPPEADRIVRSCLRKDPARRVQHMDDLRARLQDLIEELGSGAGAASSKRKSRRRLAWAAGVLGAAVLAGGIVFLIAGRHAAAPPLKAVPFATYPGWEADPSFSPEGRQIAFSWTGYKKDNLDIYIKQIGEGDPVRLTEDPDDDFSPAWSPDGSKIAFLRGRGDRLQLLTIPALGHAPETKLAELDSATPYRGYPNREIAWAPDGAHLVVFDKPAGEDPGLFLISVATREKRRLTSCAPAVLREGDPAFSPDGRALAFVRLFGYSFGHLYVLSLSPELRPVGASRRLAPGFDAPLQPAWTPNGREIIFQADNQLWRISVSGSAEPERLPFGGEQLDVSRQGRRLVYNAPSLDTSIWRLDLESGRPVGAPRTFIASNASENTSPEYSPDGKRIAFASNRDSGGFEIYLASNADGATPERLTSLGAHESGSPHWFPDSRTLVFDSDKEGKPDIYVVDVDRRAPRRLTTLGASTPTVSRDGRTIYFSSRTTGSWQIWRMSSEGRDPVQITRNGGFSACEAPTGDFLYYQKDEGLFQELWRVPVGGGEEARVLPTVGYRRFAVRSDGLYFIAWPGWGSRASLQFLRFGTGKTKTVAALDGPFLFYDFGLTVSPDGRSVLYTHPDHPNSSLMVVENFH